MYSSEVEVRGAVKFPPFMGERIYMREFFKEQGLPEDLKRWQPTVDAMLDGIDTGQPMYLMVDEGIVKPGATHRREGVHVDGYWNPGIQAHGGGGRRGHLPLPSRHSPRHSPRHTAGSSRWEDAVFEAQEDLILASNVAACRGYVGQYEGKIREGGDASDIDLSHLQVVDLEPNRVYVGNVSFLHESLPVSSLCHRTLVRINVPKYES